MTTEPTNLREKIKQALWRHDDNSVPTLNIHQVSLLTDAILPIVEEAQAEAWDKCMDAVRADLGAGHVIRRSPYERSTDDE